MARRGASPRRLQIPAEVEQAFSKLSLYALYSIVYSRTGWPHPTMTTPQRGLCATCNKSGARLACSACMSVEYCDAGCQRRSWKSHKLECKSRAASRLSLLQDGAEAGNTVAQYNLGNCYENGFGVPVDKIQAVTWYRRAAEAGHSDAQFNLGGW